MEKQVNKPMLRFPEFEGDWEIRKLGDIGKFSAGGDLDKLDFSKEKDYKHIYPIYANGSGEGLYGYATTFQFNSNCVTVSGRGNLGQANVRTQNFNAIVRLIVIKPADYIIAKFLEETINNINFVIESTGVPQLTVPQISSYKISIPCVNEQTKIASFLTAVDDKLQALKQKKTLLEQYKKGVMQKIFSQELRFKDDNGNDFPEWEEKKLGDLGKFQTSSVDKLSKENEKEVFLVNYMNVYRHENINNKTIKNFQVVTAKDIQIESCNLKKGDILFTPSSETPDDIGHSVVIFEDLEKAVYSYHLLRFRPETKIDILYSHYFCNIPKVLNQLAKLATGSTRFTISVKSFSEVLVELPCIEEQGKIANFLSAIDDKIKAVEAQIEKMEVWKKGLLQQMFC
jgi:type I restriction enzyme S subunit